MHLARALAAGSLAMLASPVLALDIPADADPIFRDGVAACLEMLDNGPFGDRPGWQSHDPGDDEAYNWNNREVMYWTNDNSGFSLVVEHYPGFALGSCEGGLRELDKPVRIPDLTQAGLIGAKEGEGDSVAWAWREDGPTPQLFIRASFAANTGNFRFSVTRIIEETQQ